LNGGTGSGWCDPLRRSAPDQRIDLARQGLLVEVDGELVERRLLLVALGLIGLLFDLRRFFLRPPFGAAAIDPDGPPLPMPWLMKLTASRRLMSCCCRK
jgi:hypothetical protein